VVLVAVHQPNFFPWLGYFDKIRRADAFVFLDEVAYPRAGSGGMGSWVNRVRIAVQGEARWITCPLKRKPLGTPICKVEIDDGQPWRTKLVKTLAASYGRSRHFESTMEIVGPLITRSEGNLAEFNMAAIKIIAAHLGLSTRFLRQSELPHHGKATELLVSLVKVAGGTCYLAGDGASGYQEDELFANSGLELIHQRFSPRPYGPAETFIPGLSVIDYLMRDGQPLEATCGAPQ
jgi:WbqC-like protein family